MSSTSNTTDQRGRYQSRIESLRRTLSQLDLDTFLVTNP
jgi:hypothetical protein